MTVHEAYYEQEIIIAYSEAAMDLLIVAISVISGRLSKWTLRLRIFAWFFSCRVFIMLVIAFIYDFYSEYVPYYASIFLPMVDLLFMTIMDIESIEQVKVKTKTNFPSIFLQPVQIFVLVLLCTAISIFLAFYWHDYILMSDFMLRPAVELNSYYILMYYIYIVVCITRFEKRALKAGKAFASNQIDKDVSSFITELLKLQQEASRDAIHILIHGTVLHMILSVAEILCVLAYKQPRVDAFEKYHLGYRFIYFLVLLFEAFWRPRSKKVVSE